MEKSDIAVWSAARTGSQRCKRKMVRPFAGTSLTDICLKKLSELDMNTFFAYNADFLFLHMTILQYLIFPFICSPF